MHLRGEDHRGDHSNGLTVACSKMGYVQDDLGVICVFHWSLQGSLDFIHSIFLKCGVQLTCVLCLCRS